MKKRKVLGIAVLLLLLLYLGGRFYFKTHFYPFTKINGVSCGLQTKEAALEKTMEHLASYVLTIHDSVTDMTVSAADAALHYENIEEVGTLLHKQNHSLWFLEIFGKHSEEAMQTVLDEEQLISYLNTLECMNPAKPQKPVSAKLTYHEETNSFELTDEIIGNTMDTDLFYAAVIDCMHQGTPTLDLTTTKYYKHPKYKCADDVVQEAKRTVDRYMQTVIQYEDSGLQYQIDAKDIHTFIKIPKNFKVTFEEDTIKSYVQEKLSPVFNTVGFTRKLTSPGSGKIVISGGTYGWQVGLIAERDAIIEDIKKGETVTRKPNYLQDAKTREKDNDIGDSYIDVNISRQMLWVVKDGKITMQSHFVSGNPNKGHQTDKGVYMIEFKRTNYEMRDYDVTVKYWLPFNTNVGEGFHDASWRSSFGSSIYLSNGSHGCVNLPVSFAKQLYETIPVGYPVIVH